MKTYYYYNILRKHIIQFLDMFSDIKISRYNSDGSFRELIKVPLKYGIKEKVWYWIYQRRNDEALPILSVIMNSCELATDRMGNKRANIIKSVTPSAGRLERFLNPTPYNIGFTLSLWSLHMVDVDQILEQILPYFSPEAYIRINIPELDASLDVKVVFQSCSPDVTDVMADEEMRVVKWNLEFMVHAWLFQPLQILGKGGNLGNRNVSFVEKLITRFYTNKEVWEEYRYLDTTSTFTSGSSGHEAESLLIKGIAPWQDAEANKFLSYELWDGLDHYQHQSWTQHEDTEDTFWDSIYFEDHRQIVPKE